MSKPLLITLLPSTDVDLGRWLLMHYGIDYKESPHAPVFHVLALKYHGAGADDYPLLVVDGKNYPTQDAIVQRYEPAASADEKLIPQDAELKEEVEKLQSYFRNDMDGGTVSWAYYNFLKHKALVWPSFTTGVPWFEKLGAFFGFWLIKLILTRALKLSDASATDGLAAVETGFSKAETLLARGGKYLCGDSLTLADLAFAASAGPMVLANGYGGHLPTIDQLPEDMKRVIKNFRARPAGAFVQRIYDEHRLLSRASRDT